MQRLFFKSDINQVALCVLPMALSIHTAARSPMEGAAREPAAGPAVTLTPWPWMMRIEPSWVPPGNVQTRTHIHKPTSQAVGPSRRASKEEEKQKGSPLLFFLILSTPLAPLPLSS